MLYRLTERLYGRWFDIKECGETFDYETEREAIDTLKAVGYKNSRGNDMGYRKVSDKELKEGLIRQAMWMTHNA